MRKIINQVFLSIAVIIVLVLICMVTVYENSQKEYVDLKRDSFFHWVENSVFLNENSRGKTLTFVIVKDATKEEITKRYEEMYDINPYKYLDDNGYYGEVFQNLQLVEQMLYAEKVNKFIEDFECYTGDIAHWQEAYGLDLPAQCGKVLVLYATEEERELYRTHPNIDEVCDYIEWIEKYTLVNW